jgi:hypothetical protein
MDLVRQRAIELRHQKQALRLELEDWRRRTKLGEKLEKHFSQVLAITAKLDNFLDLMEEPDENAPEPFKRYDNISRSLLGAHRVWAYFRSKLALRDVDWLADDLKCADELAWECYRPAREQAELARSIPPERIKEPPLVFFSNEASPFAQARHSVFEPELINQQGDVRRLGEALLLLPIPVIGIPWFQVDHLPMAVVVAHEVGHAVEHDFRLGKTLQDAFTALAVCDDRKPAWSSWRHELFADAYGVACTGPAFVQALMDFLAAAPAVIQQERIEESKWGRYPNRYLRMLVNFQLLDHLGIRDPLMEQAWKNAYPSHAMQAFDKDIEAVVSALLDTPLSTFGDLTLKEVVSFGPADVTRVNMLAEYINAGLELPEGESFRKLFSAATVAYYSAPETYVTMNGHSAVVKRMLSSITPGVRSVNLARQVERAEKIEQVHGQAGQELLDLFAA